jgi:molybdopterin biosynthesis enzyme
MDIIALRSLPPARQSTSARPAARPAGAKSAGHAAAVHTAEHTSGAHAAHPTAGHADAPPTAQDVALLQQQAAFDHMMEIRAELQREANAMRDLAMEQIKRDDAVMNQWIKLI